MKWAKIAQEKNEIKNKREAEEAKAQLIRDCLWDIRWMQVAELRWDGLLDKADELSQQIESDYNFPFH